MKPEVKKLFEKCDDLFRECIRTRDKLTCQITGTPKPVELLEVMHYVPRGNKRTRWLLDNACLGDKWLHRKTPDREMQAWYRKKHPLRVERVDAVKGEFFKVNKPSLEIVYQGLRTCFAELDGCITERMPDEQ